MDPDTPPGHIRHQSMFSRTFFLTFLPPEQFPLLFTWCRAFPPITTYHPTITRGENARGNMPDGGNVQGKCPTLNSLLKQCRVLADTTHPCKEFNVLTTLLVT